MLLLKRILAWILLAGFIFLIFNIILFGFYLQLSIIIYLVIVFFFLLANRKGSSGPKGGGNDDSLNDDQKDGG